MNDTSYTEMNHVIYHQTSPDGQIQALVEQDDRVAYFYLASDLKRVLKPKRAGFEISLQAR